MTEYLLLFFAIAACIGLLTFSYRKFAKKSYLSGSSSLIFSLPVIATTILIANTIFDDSSIKRLTEEHTIATVEFRNIGEHHFRVSFTEPHKESVEFEMFGDQWQIDARIMKWDGFAAKVGLKPVYQFERLSGRYENVQQEIHGKRSVYALHEKDNKTESIWSYLIEYQEYIPWLNSQYGSATYMPMKNAAVFTIKLSQNGLLARPRNFVASQSVKNWL